MLVPQYWAEGRARQRKKGRQFTVRRFGWSDSSPAEAQAHADARAQAALEQLLAGKKLKQREPKVPYNGAAGVPIREEIVSRHGETVITRNAYGARCLNSPAVMFVDVDFAQRMQTVVTPIGCALQLALALCCAWVLQFRWEGFVLGFSVGLAAGGAMTMLKRLAVSFKGGYEKVAHRRISRFVANHPDWHLRVYRTPAGLRVLVMHRTFDPLEPAVAECFQALGADPIYVRMCLNQRCFRARVSPKPWRIGIEQHLPPRPGVWPVKPQHLPRRRLWIESYEQAARNFAACRLIEALGCQEEHPAAQAVQMLHDELCQATGSLPIA